LKLLSINSSTPKAATYNGKRVMTSIFKQPVDGSIFVGRLNLQGDQQADLESHGGVCKAIYAYPIEHYRHWERELGRSALSFGQFGENFTVEGILESEIYVGDILELGRVVLEVTQPRVPCFKLGIRMGGLEDFPNRFLKSGLVGFYLRVLKEGEVKAGMSIKRIGTGSSSMSIRDLHWAMHFDKHNLESAKTAVSIDALSPGWRRKFERRLSAAGVPYDVRIHPFEEECCTGL
jgi:MOSC domain-containing protein YiiM